MRPLRSQRTKPQKKIWWILADYQNNMVILKAKNVNSEQEAMEYGYNHLDVPFTCVELPTISRSTAASILKARKLDQTGDLGGAIKRTMAKPPQEYKRKWWSGSGTAEETREGDNQQGGNQL